MEHSPRCQPPATRGLTLFRRDGICHRHFSGVACAGSECPRDAVSACILDAWPLAYHRLSTMRASAWATLAYGGVQEWCSAAGEGLEGSSHRSWIAGLLTLFSPRRRVRHHSHRVCPGRSLARRTPLGRRSGDVGGHFRRSRDWLLLHLPDHRAEVGRLFRCALPGSPWRFAPPLRTLRTGSGVGRACSACSSGRR